MTGDPLVSVIIPLYNAEQYISEAINSALAQTWKNIEIVVVDDGSTDSSLAVAQLFESQSVRVYQQSNRGAGSARNFGLSKSTGSYIQFLDADDLISPGKIESQMRLLNGSSCDLSAGPTIHFMDGTCPDELDYIPDWYAPGVNDTTDFLIKLYGGTVIGPGYGGMVALHSWLIPRALIDAAGPWNEELSLDDDGEFMCRVVLAAKGIRYSTNAVHYYRKYKTLKNVSSSTSYKAHISLLTSVKLRMKHLLNERDDQNARLALSRVFDDIAVSFYPEYPALTNEAEKIARQLNVKRYYEPYLYFPANLISRIFGWRAMRKLTRLKQRWRYLKQKLQSLESTCGTKI